jgi:hypothetical protein
VRRSFLDEGTHPKPHGDEPWSQSYRVSKSSRIDRRLMLCIRGSTGRLRCCSYAKT